MCRGSKPDRAWGAPGLTSATNLRDLGGYRTSDGRMVKRGLVYRSDVFHPTRKDDMPSWLGSGSTRLRFAHLAEIKRNPTRCRRVSIMCAAERARRCAGSGTSSARSYVAQFEEGSVSLVVANWKPTLPRATANWSRCRVPGKRIGIYPRVGRQIEATGRISLHDRQGSDGVGGCGPVACWACRNGNEVAIESSNSEIRGDLTLRGAKSAGL